MVVMRYRVMLREDFKRNTLKASCGAACLRAPFQAVRRFTTYNTLAFLYSKQHQIIRLSYHGQKNIYNTSTLYLLQGHHTICGKGLKE